MFGYTIKATDGELGKVHDFFFDEATRTIRYMVVETGTWLSGRKVLISLAAMGKPDWETSTFAVNLTCDQVRKSPDIDIEKPVYPHHEAELHSYYEWPEYWGGGYGGALGVTPFPIFEVENIGEPELLGEPHLRSMRSITGFEIEATDGEIGHVKDCIVEDAKWTIKYLVIDTGNWLPGKKILVPSSWIRTITLATLIVHLNHTRNAVKHSTELGSTNL
jgi:sporulation protein YlmC with PRC-barrel domain